MRIITTHKVKWEQPNKGNDPNVIYPSYPTYDKSVKDLMHELYEDNLLDYNFVENYELIKDKDINTLTKEEILTYLTYIQQNEKFCDGFWEKYIEDGTLEKLTVRYNILDDKQIFECPNCKSKKAYDKSDKKIQCDKCGHKYKI